MGKCLECGQENKPVHAKGLCRSCYGAKLRARLSLNVEWKERRRLKKQEYRRRNIDKINATDFKKHLKRKYNITIDDYNALFNAQHGKCYLCHNPETIKRNNRLAVDHDHNTGKIRRLLCFKCNTSIAMFDGNETLFEKVRLYLFGALL